MEELYRKLSQYSGSDAYPFHMPGHKRNRELMRDVYGGAVCSPYEIDITEIDGFDDLHHADGILKEAMEHMARAVGAKKSFFAVNGSTGALLAALYAACPRGSRIAAARNCHRSIAHGIRLLSLQPYYIYPPIEGKLGITLGISGGNVDDILQNAVEKYGDIAAVVITSPTYEGIVSDIMGIAETAHRHGCLLIVDEAHGGHLPYGGTGDERWLPESAVSQGADIVVQSLHKTLPALTQSAALHICSDRVDCRRVSEGLRIFETSSPSYVMMAGMDACVRYMEGAGKERLLWLGKRLDRFYRKAKSWDELYLLDCEGGFDRTKLVIGAAKLRGMGGLLYRWLLEDYHLQPEMSTPEYVLLMTTVGDTETGFARLEKALEEINERLRKPEVQNIAAILPQDDFALPQADAVLSPAAASELPAESVPIGQSEGRICAEMAYIYPPGIPFLMPGERIGEKQVRLLLYYKSYGREIHGMEDESAAKIKVIRNDM